MYLEYGRRQIHFIAGEPVLLGGGRSAGRRGEP